MHELSLCQNLIDQVEALAHQHGAVAVGRIEVHAGPLSGVEPELLDAAFRMARDGTLAARATLAIRDVPVRVACRACGGQDAVAPNDLRCPRCLSADTELIEGDALILARVELLQDESPDPS